MPHRCLPCLLLLLASGLAPAAAPPHPNETSPLDFFRKRTLSHAEQARLSALVRQLGADTFVARNKASEDLVAAGRKAVVFLRPAVNDADREIARRARWCLQEIGANAETTEVLAATARVALRRPAGAAEVLLGYLPFVEETEVEQPLFEALQAVGVRNGKIEPAVIAAVKGKAARQRAAAGWVLGRLPKAEERALALPLLKDREAMVRLRAAEALMMGRDSRGVETLIGLLELGPMELAMEAENLLALLAREKAPLVPVGEEEGQRKKARQAWTAWWREESARLEWAKVELRVRALGLRLVAVNGGYGGGGAVWEYGRDHKNRWEIRKAGGPFDVRVVAGGRVLLAEYDSKRVTERDRTGKIVWEYALKQQPLEVQRLANGNTLIVTNYEILEVTRERAVVFTFRNASGNIFSGQKLANGHILYGLYTGVVIEMDLKGKEIHRFDVERPHGLANIEVLGQGKYVMPVANRNRIVEIDRTGKVLREVSISSPTCVAVLPGGNLLVGSHMLNSVREIDWKGNVVWEHKAQGQVFRVRVR